MLRVIWRYRWSKIWIGEDVLGASKSEKEERDGADEFPYDSNGVPTGCRRKRTEESAHWPIHRGAGRCFGIHGGRDRVSKIKSSRQRRVRDAGIISNHGVISRRVAPAYAIFFSMLFSLIINIGIYFGEVFRTIISFLNAPRFPRKV